MLIDAAGMRSRHWLSKRSSVPDLASSSTAPRTESSA